MGDTKSKGMGRYPAGNLNQHKELATGRPLRQADTKDLDPTGWGPGGMGKGSKISSSGTTGGGYKKTPPKTSRSTPA